MPRSARPPGWRAQVRAVRTARTHHAAPAFALEETMAKGSGDFTDILVKKQILSPDQLTEARSLQQQTGAKLQDTLVKLGYCSLEDAMSAIAEFHGMQFVNLTTMTIPPSVIELVPESVARDNVVLPMPQANGTLN